MNGQPVVLDLPLTEALAEIERWYDVNLAVGDTALASRHITTPINRASLTETLAVVALADLLDDAPPFSRSGELVELADDAPTLHVYVRDLASRCTHRAWRDPGAEEWADVMTQLAGPAIVN